MFISQQFAANVNPAAFGSELKSIGLQVEEHLLYSLHVTANHQSLVVIPNLFLKTFIMLNNLDCHIICFFLLDQINLLNSLFDVKVAHIFSELARLKLGKI